MKSPNLPVNSTAYIAQRSQNEIVLGSRKIDSTISRISKHGERVENLALRIRENVKLGAKIAETLKAKLSLGAKILQAGGVANIFKLNFSVTKGERLLKASQCYLWTTAGPIEGLLFISTHKVAFCSERSIKLSGPNGEFFRYHYKVVIPVRKIEKANEIKNVKTPSRKYIQIVTEDNFEFWFMGFLNYQKSFKHLLQAASQDQ